MICYEIIKHSSHAMLTALQAKYFNLILDTSVYPDKWNQSYIIPILKSGDQFNPMNYRGMRDLADELFEQNFQFGNK